MAGLSKSQIIAWLRAGPRTMGWGAVLAFNRSDTNTLLLQEYINRFSTGSYLAPVRGYIGDSSTQGQYIYDYLMDSPRLSFEIANVEQDRADARLTMQAVGGTQVTFRDIPGGREATRIEVVDPLNGPELILDLRLREVPGTVNSAGQVVLDLKDSSHFRLTYSEDDHEQALGGEFFQALFEKLPDSKRIMVISEVVSGAGDVIKPRSLKLRTQAAPGAKVRSAENYGDGAVLLFVGMQGEPDGSSPSATFNYLIANDTGKDYSATVLLSNKVLMNTVIAGGLRCAFAGHLGIQSVTRPDGFTSLVLTTGTKTLAYQQYTYDGNAFEWDPMNFPVAQPGGGEGNFPDTTFTVSAANDRLAFRWSGVSLTNLWLRPTFQPQYRHVIRNDFNVLGDLHYVVQDAADAATLIPYKDAQTLTLSMQLYGSGNATVAAAFPTLAAQQKSKALDTLQQVFSGFFDNAPALNVFVLQNLLFRNAGAVLLDDVAVPGDMAIFGRVGPTRTRFSITPTQTVVRIGEKTTLLFHVLPYRPSSDLTWAVENILGDTGDPGYFIIPGSYRAPAIINGSFKRVKVTARTDNYSSCALITLTDISVTVCPVVQVCMGGHSCELSIGSIEERLLICTLKVPANGGRLVRANNKKYTYTAPTQLEGKNFYVEEVVVTYLLGITCSAYIMVILANMALGLMRDKTVSLPAHQIKLRARLGTSLVPDELLTWRVLAGSGSIVNGVFTAPTTPEQRFAVLLGSYELTSDYSLQGYMLLPLPLFDYPEDMSPGLQFREV